MYLLVTDGVQASHIDLPRLNEDMTGMDVIAGCMYLTKDSPSTILYDMTGVKASGQLSYDDICKDIWADAPVCLRDALAEAEEKTKESSPMALLNSAGRVLYATPGRRLPPIKSVPCCSILYFDYDTPHCASRSKQGKRMGIFFVAGRDQHGEYKDGGISSSMPGIKTRQGSAISGQKKGGQGEKFQISKVKLLYHLFNAIKKSKNKEEAVRFLHEKFIEAVTEGAVYGASLDVTMDLPNGKFESYLSQFIAFAKEYGDSYRQMKEAEHRLRESKTKQISSMLKLKRYEDCYKKYYDSNDAFHGAKRELDLQCKKQRTG